MKKIATVIVGLSVFGMVNTASADTCSNRLAVANAACTKKHGAYAGGCHANMQVLYQQCLQTGNWNGPRLQKTNLTKR